MSLLIISNDYNQKIHFIFKHIFYSLILIVACSRVHLICLLAVSTCLLSIVIPSIVRAIHWVIIISHVSIIEGILIVVRSGGLKSIKVSKFMTSSISSHCHTTITCLITSINLIIYSLFRVSSSSLISSVLPIVVTVITLIKRFNVIKVYWNLLGSSTDFNLGNSIINFSNSSNLASELSLLNFNHLVDQLVPLNSILRSCCFRPIVISPIVLLLISASIFLI